MTYRQVPQKWRLIAQLATLGVTALLGLSIAFTPPNADAKLTVIEHAMSVTLWAWIMMGFGTVGLVTEGYISRKDIRPRPALFLISICHIMCMSVLLGYSASAIASVIRTGHWYAFGGPCLGFYLCLMHYVYVNRRYMGPNDMIGKLNDN